MEDSDTCPFSLEEAKSSFLRTLSKLDPKDSEGFVEWVTEHCSNAYTCKQSGENIDYTFKWAEKRLKNITKDIKRIIPLQGVLETEKIRHPEEGKGLACERSTTVHVDSFLYNDEDIDKLCDEGRMSRNYCKQCGSHNTAPLTFISHSSSLVQLKFIFQAALSSIATNFADKLLVDVGSRLGAVLYGAYHFSPIKKIVGVEINSELCDLQQKITEKYRMHDRVELFLKFQNNFFAADIVVLNNVFEFFLSMNQQIRTWKFIREHVTKPGCILVTVPSLEEATEFNNKPCIDVNSWVKPCIVNYDVLEIPLLEEDLDELQNIFFYQVK
ncbi:uncharacterized protein LOC113670567 [Pocillopora damicornis]|uniref:uncharacterized protein LOC113670567 n=1 Tax=Pocillopora damicornis TaxID=46731 RepID=UPI000F554CA1|nr:uncharacterized protein LOC113670567 [Pocillopora damicornis]